MRQRKTKRFLAFMLTVAMLLGVLPVDMLGGIVSVKAAENSHSVEFTSISSEGKTDKAAIEAGTAFGDGDYFKTVGSVTYRVDAGKETIKAVELKAKEAGGISFTTTGTTAKVSFTVSSTGGSNTSAVALKTSNGTSMKSTDAKEVTEVTGTSKSEVSFENLGADTYTLVAYKDGDTYTSGLRVFSISVVESADDGNTDPSVSGNTDPTDDTITYDSVYDFRNGSIIPTDTNGKDTVTSDDGKLTVACGSSNQYGYNGADQGSVFKPGNTITIAVKGNTTIDIAGCQYSNGKVSLSKEDGTSVADAVESKTEKCYHQDNAQVISFTYTGEETNLVLNFSDGTTYVPLITVHRTEPKPAATEIKATVTVKDENGLLGEGDTVTLVNQTDAADSHDVTTANATEVTLKVNATYDVVSSNPDIAASVDGKTTVVTTTEDKDIVIELASTVVNPTVKINDPAKVLPEGAKITLTNDSDNTVLTLEDGKAVKLSIGAGYTLATDAAVVVAIAGSTKFKVPEVLDTLQVEVSAEDTTHHTYDVWDFGAEQIENTDLLTFNNKLTEDIINAWYPGVTAGTSGQGIPGDLVAYDEAGNKEFVFNIGGSANAKKHRYRTTNTNLTRYDGRSLTDIEDPSVVYSGYLYSNAKGTDKVNVQLAVKAGDIVTFAVSSNGGTSDIVWMSPSGEKTTQTYSGTSGQAQLMTFYAAEDGMYTLYSAIETNEKLVVARILRERPTMVTVSGAITAPEGADLSGASLVFTNDLTGQVTKAAINNGSYSVTLSEQYGYNVSLEGANGYIVGATAFLELANEAGNTSFPVEIIGVELIEVSGSLADLTAEAAAKLELEFTSDAIYVPEITINASEISYTAKFEKDVTYQVAASGVDDYTLDTTEVTVAQAGTQDIHFTKKDVYAVNIALEGPSAEEAKNVKLTFTRVDPQTGEADKNYVYSYTGTENIALRDGQYRVEAVLAGYTQKPTADVKVNGAAVDKTIVMQSDKAEEAIAYKAQITVGSSGDYQTINDALDAVRRMNREDGQRVTISIAPGNYEEMLVIDVADVTLKNASATPSIALKDQGVNIDDNAVRITSYYGHGYTYYSMGDDCKYDADLLAVNKENGYPSFVNPGSGTTSGSYWNATVSVKADGFQADGIIFENSFNQYVSAKAADDIIVKQSSAKEGTTPRAEMAVGDVTVQNKAYVERAAALAIYNNISDVVFDNCKFVGRQDTLYGGKNVYAEFNQCSVYGGTDYIFGGMTAIFNQCDLVFNTSDDKNDVGYITAAQQTTGRGYLMYECHVTSTVPGVDTASTYTSKPGYFGRPWAANTSEVVFYNTTIDAADEYWVSNTNIKAPGKSLIAAEGWNDTLSGQSAGMYEYGTIEKATDYSAARVAWATKLDTPVLNDGTAITLEAFRKPEVIEGLYKVDLNAGLKKGTTYEGGISVLEDMPYKAVSGTGDVIGGVTYAGYVAGGNNPKADGANCAGNVPQTGSALILNAEKDGKLKIAMKINSGKTVYLVDATEDTIVEEYKNSSSASEFVDKSYKVEKGHTYYFYGGGTKVPMYAITVDYREPIAWEDIAAPVLGTPVVDNKAGTITVPYTAQVGGRYADAIEIKMLSGGSIVDTVTATAEGSEGTVTFTPAASGNYSFQAVLRRTDCLGKNSNVTSEVAFVLPMKAPVIIGAENQGDGTVKLSWKEVTEADSYKVYLDGVLTKEGITQPFYRFTGLTVGQTYTFAVVAVRGADVDVSEKSEIKQTVTADSQKSWHYAAFGSGVDTKNNGYTVNEDGSITLRSQGTKGKLVPASTDGLAFYYTTIDPEKENFVLSADVTVDTWKFTNGQEGFGLMAADNVGTDGDSSVFWNNSYMASVTKVEYYWDASKGAVSDSGAKYTMKLGVGSQEKIGVTPENVADGTSANQLKSTMTTLETSVPMAGKGAGTYNVVGNYSNEGIDLGDFNTQTTFHLEIRRNNTGYAVSYTDANGQTTTKQYYHGDDGDELTKLDENNIYVGFFAAREAKIVISNIQLTTSNPATDAPAEARPITYVTPNCSIESAKTANAADYELVYYGNADGTLTIKNSAGQTVADGVHVDAKTKFRVNTTLNKGSNTFAVEFVPDADYQPSKYERLSSYDAVKFNFTVTYNVSSLKNIYISPNGSASGTGTKGNPKDIYSAVKEAAPGQTLILMEGTYALSSTVVINRGIDGTEDAKIYMIADPEANSRPVLDFQGKCAGMTLAGDYWYFKGFDVTNSANGQKGIQVSGSYNTLDNLRTYKNGNTGLQISRYLGTDNWEDWPSHNLILNCTSYLNADAGYEDADGFAAKLTIADGNVFDGCIAAYNADDGWDLFAKVESGPIGKVVIKNCVAFKNGYVIGADGAEVDAGNGNGFKMGGSSITGYHTLENSIAFGNKAKGIDSNSCPDIQIYNSTSYNNESYNVALYTNDAKNTDFLAQGILSYKDANGTKDKDNFKLLGTQDETKVYGSTNYFFNGKKSANTVATGSAKVVTADWFKSLDMVAAIAGGITRNADGSINMGGFLELTDNAPADTGARMSGTASRTIVPIKEDKATAEKVVTAQVSGTIPETVLTDAIKKATGCDTVEKLVDYLAKTIINNTTADQILPGVKSDNLSIMEVTIMVSFDGGVTWEKATEENFPAAGLDLVIPYPTGTNASNYDFVITHLVTMACNDMVPGSLEYFRPAKTDQGLKIHIKSASPFAVGWVEKSNDNDDDDDTPSQNPEGNNNGNTAEQQSADGRKSPKTFDASDFVPVEAGTIVAAVPSADETGDGQQAAVEPLITVAAAGANPVVFHWWIVALATLVGCAAAAVGYWNYRRKKEEE